MTRIIAVTSGKGGVGKTHLGVNLALHCARTGLRVRLFDADLSATSLRRLGDESGALSDYDLIIFDTSSEVAGTVPAVAAAASELLLVITPEPTALTDAYALVKQLHRRQYSGRIQVVVNQAQSERQAQHTYEKFREVVWVYQGVELPLLGWIPLEPQGEAHRAIAVLAMRLIEQGPVAGADSPHAFWRRLSDGLPPEDGVPPQAHSGVTLNGSSSGILSLPREEPARSAAFKGRRAGESGAAARFVRNAQRATPIDALQLRRVVGRMLVKAMPASDGGGGVAQAEPVRIDVEQVQMDAANEYSLRPGRYTRISLHCRHIQSPDHFIEEIFATCAISGCKVRHLGTHVRYWLTSGRDGCILLDGDDHDRNCVHVYMAAGGNALMAFEVEEPESIPSLRRMQPAGGVVATPETLLEKFPHQQLSLRTVDGEVVELFRLLRRDRAPLLCAFQRAGDETAAGSLRERSP